MALRLREKVSKLSITRLFISLLAAFVVSACATDRTIGSAAGIEVTDLTELPPPGEEVYYKIGPQQALNVSVVGAPDLSGTYLTDGAGNLEYPLIGEVATNGKSPNEVSRMIASRLRGQFVLDPQVRVIPRDFQPPSVSVGGEVETPGEYPVTASSSLLRVVNQAEGLAEFAKLDDVLIMRSVGGQQYIGAFNIKAIQRGNYPDPRIYPNDVVMVGESTARNRLAFILQFVPLLSSSIILIDRLGQ
ncbi:polysaccharide biosynthesis/export family protein [Erythrobacter sp. W53]|uniref:polysaccharide biosynthesis/export family protein n=1 Tax=Erythrobacter sp. W53 TaxID=3425947 RepID=UPI003D76761A